MTNSTREATIMESPINDNKFFINQERSFVCPICKANNHWKLQVSLFLDGKAWRDHLRENVVSYMYNCDDTIDVQSQCLTCYHVVQFKNVSFQSEEF